MRIAVLFATEMEAQPFREQCNQNHASIAVADIMGMTAARNATQSLLKSGIDCLINAGVCGALNNQLERTSVYLIDEVFNVDRISCSVAHDLPSIHCPVKKLVTVAQPVFAPARKTALAQFADLVDMEGYAVASLCQQHHIPCILVKGVTDFGDGDGKSDIQKHLRPVSEKVATAVCSILEILTAKAASEE